MRSPFDAGHDFGTSLRERGPRTVGVYTTVFGAVCLAATYISVTQFQTIWAPVMIFGSLCTPFGLWTLATGRLDSSPGNPLWWKVGFYALIGLSVAAGFWVYVALTAHPMVAGHM